MLFGKPANIPGFPRHVLYRCKGMGWCLTDTATCDPVFVGADCWFSTKGALVAALGPILATHIPAQGHHVVRMQPRAAFVSIAV